MKAFLTSPFGHRHLVWMFHSRDLNHKINSFHERTLRITYRDRLSSFQDLLKKKKPNYMLSLLSLYTSAVSYPTNI